MRATTLSILLLIAACGGSSRGDKVPDHPGPVVGTQGEGGEPPDGNAGGQDEVAASAEAPLNEVECKALIKHMLDLSYAKQTADQPEDMRPNEADMQEALKALKASVLPECVGANRGEVHFDCAMGSETEESLRACLGEK